ncbi:MAG: helix-turn-helix domain-containing protein [Vicinamibacteria bacterium]
MAKNRLSPTLREGLESYAIGARLRALRLRKKMGLVELGRHTGLSPAMLSKLERGKLFPTLPTLLRVALVFGVGLDHFFAAGAERRVAGIVRAAERRRFVERLGGRDVVFEFECLDFASTERRLNAYRVWFTGAPARPRTHEHAGAEFVHVLTGKVGITIDGAEHALGPGDSMYFDSTHAHGYRRLSAKPCEAVVVTTGG